ncbi:MAG: hypothetical protein CMF22_11930 [Idiomarinaceae bacterium]|nr:hypothetical protein [Idiomarinaceae bacterium]|tara:strand:+ start:23068 stop:23481 length:414 start_codon:yes stop_codon:yes gene_type:complete
MAKKPIQRPPSSFQIRLAAQVNTGLPFAYFFSYGAHKEIEDLIMSGRLTFDDIQFIVDAIKLESAPRMYAVTDGPRHAWAVEECSRTRDLPDIFSIAYKLPRMKTASACIDSGRCRVFDSALDALEELRMIVAAQQL